MHALPFLLALAGAALLAPPLLRALAEGGHTRPNYRGRELPFPFGVLTLAAALLALVPLMLAAAARLAAACFHPETLPIAVYALGVLALGLIDDTLGERSGRRERGAPLAARLARPRRGGAARRALHRRAEGGRLARAGAAGDELARPLRRALAAGGGRAGARDERLQPARPAPRARRQGVRAARRGPDDRRGELRPLWALGLFAAPGARRRRSTTCASGRCSATPAPTCSARSRACGWCSRCRAPGS